jgi:hypothetical protein
VRLAVTMAEKKFSGTNGLAYSFLNIEGEKSFVTTDTEIIVVL